VSAFGQVMFAIATNVSPFGLGTHGTSPTTAENAVQGTMLTSEASTPVASQPARVPSTPVAETARLLRVDAATIYRAIRLRSRYIVPAAERSLARELARRRI